MFCRRYHSGTQHCVSQALFHSVYRQIAKKDLEKRTLFSIVETGNGQTDNSEDVLKTRSLKPLDKARVMQLFL